MSFAPDKRFTSRTDAFKFISDQHASRGPERLTLASDSGLRINPEAPRFLFRGECGDFQNTKSVIYRPSTYALRKNGRRLSPPDVDLIPALARRFTEADYSVEEHHSIGLLQHYGLPTSIVDFTIDLDTAFAFATAGNSTIGRIAVMPMWTSVRKCRVIDLTDHRWAERPRRQLAFGVIMPQEFADLKSSTARSHLEIRWYEFPVTDEDRQYLLPKYKDLVSHGDDPSAGFLRFHITEHVEEHGKLPPALTDWLLERIPIAPRCCLIKGSDNVEAVVHFCAPNLLPPVDEATEAEYSLRYWSTAYPESSLDRMKDFRWPPPGFLVADPRTYHPGVGAPIFHLAPDELGESAGA